MPRHSLVGHRFLALFLSCTVLWGCLACVSLCGFEATIHAAEKQASNAVDYANDECFTTGENSCLCPDAVNPAAVLQQRETVTQLLSLDITVPTVSIHVQASLPRLKLPDKPREYLPPKLFTAPLFVRLCTFRI